MSKLTLVEMGLLCHVQSSQLSRMERGEETFLEKYAEFYERLLERRRRSGDDW